ncbi:MEMO1 family [Gongronella butleri]|nr:MEMO1 family [Gongronella butleri]
MTKTRRATHAGSWYTDNKTELDRQLDRFISDANDIGAQSNVKAIIGPHAGFAYSGPTAAYAYNCIDIEQVERVFLLGPSHHVYLQGCALSQCDEYATPLGNLALDRDTLDELAATNQFTWMGKDVDEDEHSIEMHLPYVYKIFESKIDQIKVVPILVGATNAEKERQYGRLLAPYLQDPKTLFIVSSDFCHWGQRFRYMYYEDEAGGGRTLTSHDKSMTVPIHESIRALDQAGIATIASLDFDAFQDYLARTRNTICGRHPIGVLLAAVECVSSSNKRCIFTNYAQSNACQTAKDSSVSYASAYITL